MEAFRIGEFARQNGISVQLLKYYDQQGILSPAWKDETGRYYMDYQSIHLMEYTFLGDTGLTLQEAKKLREEGTLADWYAHLSHACSEMENEILERQFFLQSITEMRNYLEQIQHKESWRIEFWEGGWFIPKERTGVCWPRKKNGRPMFQPWQRVILDNPANIHGAQKVWGTLLPKSLPQDSTGLDAVHGGLCFVYTHGIPLSSAPDPTRPSSPLQDFNDPLSIMADNNLKPRGELYQRMICVTHEGKDIQKQVVTRIPLQQDV